MKRVAGRSLRGRKALVTGGNSGIGLGIAKALADAGALVAINCYDNLAAARKVARSIAPKTLAVEADVSDPAAVAAMFRQLDRAWGGLDILVNNAGIDGKRAMAWEGKAKDWIQVIGTNLLGPYYCSHEALGRMVHRRRGVVVNITSVHEEIAWSGYSAYTASKAAVGMLTKTLAQEAAPFGVRVLAVAPGAIQTPINQAVWSDPAGYRDLMKKIPLGRMGQPAEIGAAVAFLVSDDASYITGRTVFVDGGMTDYPDFARGG